MQNEIDVIGHHTQAIKLLMDHFGDKPIEGIEIGTGGGDLTVAMLLNLPNLKKLYTIDPWIHVDKAEFEAGEPQSRHDEAKRIATSRLAEYADRVEIMHMTSEQAYLLCPKQVDFVWIDGDHTGKTVEFDCDNYGQLVRPGGILGGHDYGQVHPLTELIKERFGDRIITGVDFTWWVLA